jgi:imidazoleglycerol phosphate synthase glutamine amidotransferase subunit HisH
MTRVAILDYGVGNLRSVEKASAAGSDAIVSDDDVFARSRALVFRASARSRRA